MKVRFPSQAVLNIIEELLTNHLIYARELGSAANIDQKNFDLYDKVEFQIIAIKNTIESKSLSTDYASALSKDLDKLKTAFSTGYGSMSDRAPTIFTSEDNKETFKKQQEAREPEIRKALQKLNGSADFFIKLDFFNRNIVVVGANGSGKTSLSRRLPGHFENKAILISAQRILLLPAFESIRSHTITDEQVKSIQQVTDHITNLKEFTEEFSILIEHLLADDSKFLRQTRRVPLNNALSGFDFVPGPTKLQTLLGIWNSLFPQIQIELSDDINIQAKKESLNFRVGEMSEGEKVTMFLLAHVLLCPENGFVIVDEPEMYLHPAVYKKLWDRLEIERSDCKFIYLTHNLDFAASRTNAKKVWLHSFKYPAEFAFEDIPTNVIPEPLMLELLGSRQNILFCEGEPSGLDETLYSILFPKHTVKPVRSCRNVINYTKAFNRLDNTYAMAVGVIDSDFHSLDSLSKLEKEKIFNIRLPEIENLLFDEVVLKAVCQNLNCTDKVDKIKNLILRNLTKDKGIQISNQVSARISSYFKNSHVSEGNDIASLKANLSDYLTKIRIDEWAQEQEEKISRIISEQNYSEVIRVFNHKGLESMANSILKTKDYNQIAISLIRTNESLRNHLLKYFPQSIS